MSFFSKMQNALANWMQGRNGPDNLGFTALIAACRWRVSCPCCAMYMPCGGC